MEKKNDAADREISISRLFNAPVRLGMGSVDQP